MTSKWQHYAYKRTVGIKKAVRTSDESCSVYPPALVKCLILVSQAVFEEGLFFSSLLL